MVSCENMNLLKWGHLSENGPPAWLTIFQGVWGFFACSQVYVDDSVKIGALITTRDYSQECENLPYVRSSMTLPSL